MNRRHSLIVAVFGLAWISLIVPLSAQTAYRSHAPMRPLPAAVERPLPAGPKHFVDARQGDDLAPGTQQAPWHTLRHACRQLTPGDTLYLRGGTYFEHVPLMES